MALLSHDPLTRYICRYSLFSLLDTIPFKSLHPPTIVVIMPEESSNSTEKINQPDQERPAWLIDFLSRPRPSAPSPLWSPPEDPDKPSLPYIPGFALNINRHVPPPSFLQTLRKNLEPRPFASETHLRNIPQSRAVVEYPPIETDPPARPETARLVVAAPICIGAARGAQIVRCIIYPQSDSGKSYEAIAKIYDPLYYNFKAHLCHQPQDVMYDADMDYSNEAAAYNQLHKIEEMGSFAPAYYGSWTFHLPITVNNESYHRPVRLILMEELNGRTIRDTRIRNDPSTRTEDSFHYPEDYRLEVFTRAMDAFVRQLQYGVNQSNFVGRNVLLVQDNSETPHASETSVGLRLPRVVLIDYNNAIVNQDSPIQPLPENPISIFWNVYLWEDFAGWAPNEWEDGKSHMKWLIRRFNEDGRRKLYLPVREGILKEIQNYHESGS